LVQVNMHIDVWHYKQEPAIPPGACRSHPGSRPAAMDRHEEQRSLWLQGGLRGAVALPKKPWQLLVPGGPWPPPTSQQPQPPTPQQSQLASQPQAQLPQQLSAPQPQPQSDAPGAAATGASQTAAAAPTVRDQVSKDNGRRDVMQTGTRRISWCIQQCAQQKVVFWAVAMLCFASTMADVCHQACKP
jgi:hypothetical protein